MFLQALWGCGIMIGFGRVITVILVPHLSYSGHVQLQSYRYGGEIVLTTGTLHCKHGIDEVISSGPGVNLAKNTEQYSQ